MPLPDGLYFTAPLDFDERVMLEFVKLIPPARNPFDATVWVCNPKANFVIDEAVLRDYWRLKVLATPSTGTNHIDLDACKRRGVKVLSLLDDRAGLETISASAEFTFKLLLDALRIPPARELQGKVIGLVGYGRIGKQMAYACKRFQAKYVYHDPYQFWDKHCKRSLGYLFAECDAVIICCALTPETTGMIGADLLRSMKHGAALVNTARGEIINEHDLLTVMDERPDLRIALDVLTGEVNGTANPEPFKARGAIVTPHIAGETYDSRTKAARIIWNLLQKELTYATEKGTV